MLGGPQANTRSDQGKASILAQWVSSMVASYASKVNWPLQTMKLDDQLTYAKVITRPSNFIPPLLISGCPT